MFYQSGFCAMSIGDPLSRALYNRKRREGKHHTQALIAFARRRVTVLWVMLHTRQAFGPTRRLLDSHIDVVTLALCQLLF